MTAQVPESMDDITFWSRLFESSPVIVLVLFGIIFSGGRFGWMLVHELLRRLDRERERGDTTMAQSVKAINDNTEALRELVRAINDRRP